MRWLKCSLKSILEIFLGTFLIYLVMSSKKAITEFLSSNQISTIPEIVSNSIDFISKQKFINFDRDSLKNQNYSFLENRSSTDFKFILYYTDCAFGCWGNRRNRIVKNCLFSRSRTILKVHEYDALLFHVGQNWKPQKSWNVPEYRSPHQHYIMYTHE